MQPDVGTRPPEQGRRARHVAVMRERLIEVSLDLYDRRGFGATTIDQIAADAEVHRSTFFRYFENKEAVLFAHSPDPTSGSLTPSVSSRPASR